jgi:hypothetical protein
MNTLRGRVAVIAGDGPELVPICQRLLAGGVSLAVVGPDRTIVQAAIADVPDPSLTVVPMTADPSDPEVWDRLVPHAEQRLGPIDIAVAIGPKPLRDLAYDRLVADMIRRGHGVFIESDATSQPREAVMPITYRFVPRDHPDLPTEVTRQAADAGSADGEQG